MDLKNQKGGAQDDQQRSSRSPRLKAAQDLDPPYAFYSYLYDPIEDRYLQDQEPYPTRYPALLQSLNQLHKIFEDSQRSGKNT